MKYQWLLFDADGTLFDYDKAEASALADTFDQIGYPFYSGYVSKYRRINGNLWQAFERGDITQTRLKLERFELLCQELGLENDPAELFLSSLAQLRRYCYVTPYIGLE